MTTQTKEVPAARQEKAVVVWQQREITVTFNDVKRYLCQKATDQEIVLFLKTCQGLGLNPWVREIHMVKYKEDEPAAIIIATEAYLKSAETCPEFDGHEAGIILKDTAGKLEFRQGAFLLDEEEKRLAGGWAKVYRKDRARPFYVAVNIKECEKYTREGRPTRFWREMPATMVRKVALSRALREAFPTRLGGLYTTAEYEEVSEGELPPAYEKNGEPDWKLWWARQREKGLSVDDVHDILGVTSLKEDWLGTGRTLEEAEDIIEKALPLVARAKALNLSIKQISDMMGMALGEWFIQGRTVYKAVEVISRKLSQPGAASKGGEEKERESFNIDLQWLKEAKQTLKWTDETMLSFITSQYKVTGETDIEALNRLTREQAKDFISQIDARLEKQQSSLFE
jgi:phage recombination protein Bet